MNAETNTKSHVVSLLIMALISKIYKTPKDAIPFIQEMEKYIDNKTYMSDRMWEFPGKDLKSEARLRSIFQIIFERRI